MNKHFTSIQYSYPPIPLHDTDHSTMIEPRKLKTFLHIKHIHI